MTSRKVYGSGYRQEPPLVSWTGIKENRMIMVGSRIVWSYIKLEVAKNIGMITLAKNHLISSVKKIYRFQKVNQRATAICYLMLVYLDGVTATRVIL